MVSPRGFINSVPREGLTLCSEQVEWVEVTVQAIFS